MKNCYRFLLPLFLLALFTSSASAQNPPAQIPKPCVPEVGHLKNPDKPKQEDSKIKAPSPTPIETISINFLAHIHPEMPKIFHSWGYSFSGSDNEPPKGSPTPKEVAPSNTTKPNLPCIAPPIA